MRLLFYQFLAAVSHRVGVWFTALFAWIISTGYFLFCPGRVRNSLRFYKALFPHRNTLFHYWFTLRQYHSFSQVYAERLLLAEGKGMTFSSTGFEHFREAAVRGSGGIIIMSHIGNWETAASTFHARGMRLMLYMGRKERESIEKVQKKELAHLGITIVSIEQEMDGAFNLLEAANFIREGGFVSLPGDILWTRDQRSTLVEFAGHTVPFPVAPHALALITGAPVFIFFALRQGRRHYHNSTTPPRFVHAPSRAERAQAMAASAQWYAKVLEEKVRAEPEQWYRFDAFLPEEEP